MSDGAQGLLILGSIAVVVSLPVHYFLRNYLVASLVSGVLASSLFQVVLYIRAGHLDPFFLIAFVTGTIAAFGVALVVGLFFRKRNAGLAR